MPDPTRATLHVPIPIKNKTGSNEVTCGEFLYYPKNAKAWLKKLCENAEGNEELFFTVSNLTDCPDTFYLTLSSYPDNEALNGMDHGTHLGIYTNAEVLRAIRDAFNFMLGEVERNNKDR